MTAVAGDSSPVRVVIAEDEAIIRLDLREILIAAGYAVVGETGRGDEAVALVEQHRPELVILDVKMPGMDGLLAAREITARNRVAVLILTAFSQRELIEDARDAGVTAYLVKPFRRNELLPAIDAVLATCRQEWAIDAEIESEINAESAGPAMGGIRDGSTPGDAERIAENKIETRRVVEEAKAFLIEHFEMSESEAFSFVQRTAMRTRTRMRDVAHRVVDGSLTP